MTTGRINQVAILQSPHPNTLGANGSSECISPTSRRSQLELTRRGRRRQMGVFLNYSCLHCRCRNLSDLPTRSMLLLMPPCWNPGYTSTERTRNSPGPTLRGGHHWRQGLGAVWIQGAWRAMRGYRG